MYERFAYFLLHVYEPDQRKGKEHLDGSTTRNYLSIVIHLACDKFKAVGLDASKRFFDCLDTNSTSEFAKWLRGVKANKSERALPSHSPCAPPLRTTVWLTPPSLPPCAQRSSTCRR